MWWMYLDDESFHYHYTQMPRVVKKSKGSKETKITFDIPKPPKTFKKTWWQRKSGYEYLGPFTDLSKVGHVAPANRLDEIAMRHDLAYAKASADYDWYDIGATDRAKARADLISGAEMIKLSAQQADKRAPGLVWTINLDQATSMLTGTYLMAQGMFRFGMQAWPKVKGFALPW